MGISINLLVEKFGPNCWYCGSNRVLETEHQIPLSRGGTDDPSNLVPACRSCNVSKSSKTVEEFRTEICARLGVTDIRFFGESGKPITIPRSSRKFVTMTVSETTYNKLVAVRSELGHKGLQSIPSEFWPGRNRLTMSDIVEISIKMFRKGMIG